VRGRETRAQQGRQLFRLSNSKCTMARATVAQRRSDYSHQFLAALLESGIAHPTANKFRWVL